VTFPKVITYRGAKVKIYGKKGNGDCSSSPAPTRADFTCVGRIVPRHGFGGRADPRRSTARAERRALPLRLPINRL